MKRDFYEILGLTQAASDREIKTSYRKLAHELHPDKNPGSKEAEEKFKEATQAYSVLSDPEKRAHYDRFGQTSGDNFSVNIEDIFGSVIGDIFGTGRGRYQSRSQRGTDLGYELLLSFEEAAFGLEREVTLKRQEICSSCHGTGAKSGSKAVNCRTCGGIGEVRISQGFFAVAQTCPNCLGAGQIISNPCIDCRGSRLKKVDKNLTIKIPPGVDHGIKLRFNGEGNAGLEGGPRGDLLVILSVREHPLFKREGYDVICDIPISFVQAALGAQIEVPTLEGKAPLNIPAGTQTGHVFTLIGKGIPHLRSRSPKKGDELVRVTVKTPKNLSAEQKEVLKQFANLTDHKSFFDKVKTIFD